MKPSVHRLNAGQKLKHPDLVREPAGRSGTRMSQSAGRFLAFPEPGGAEPDVGDPLDPEVRVLVGDDVSSELIPFERRALSAERIHGAGI